MEEAAGEGERFAEGGRWPGRIVGKKAVDLAACDMSTPPAPPPPPPPTICALFLTTRPLVGESGLGAPVMLTGTEPGGGFGECVWMMGVVEGTEGVGTDRGDGPVV